MTPLAEAGAVQSVVATTRTMECAADNGGAFMSVERQVREKISTRIEVEAARAIEQAAERQRTTPSHIARMLLEDGARNLAEGRPA